MAHQPFEPTLARLVGANVRQARRTRTLKEVAGGAGISVAMLSRLELGGTLPSVSVLLRLAVSLGVPVETLFTERKAAA